MCPLRKAVVLAGVFVLCGQPLLRAQQAQDVLEAQRVAGWSFTPTMAFSSLWDDNVLVLGQPEARGDYTTVFNPQGVLEFNGRRSEFSANYNGAFQVYRQFDALNSFEQHEDIKASRRLTSRTKVFGLQSFASTPTTELPELIGIPFVRVGSRIFTAQGGLETFFTKRTSMSGAYNAQWIDFDPDPVLGRALLGGHSQGGLVSLRHQMTARTAISTEYELQRARIVDGGTFNVQNGRVGAEHRLTDTVKIFGSFGLARLDTTDLLQPKTLPAWQGGISRTVREMTVSASYGRSFLPTFGRGITLRNDELKSQVQLPLGRRTYVLGTFTWRQDHPLTVDPLTFGELNLTSVWTAGAFGYAIRPWVRIEGFYNGGHQEIDRPGGRMDRNQIGFQVITVKPVRIR